MCPRPALPSGSCSPIAGSCRAGARPPSSPAPAAQPSLCPAGRARALAQLSAPRRALPPAVPSAPSCHYSTVLCCPCPRRGSATVTYTAPSPNACESSLLCHHPEIPVCPLPSASVVHLGTATEVSAQADIPGPGYFLISGGSALADAQRRGSRPSRGTPALSQSLQATLLIPHVKGQKAKRIQDSAEIKRETNRAQCNKRRCSDL